MEAWTNLLFILNITFITVHELDAIQQHEWRAFFGFTPLSDEAAYRLFTALHVPLLLFILWNLHSYPFQVGLDIFLIIHAGVHWILRNHPLVTFNNWFSRIWIFGGALLGALHLLLLL